MLLLKDSDARTNVSKLRIKKATGKELGDFGM